MVIVLAISLGLIIFLLWVMVGVLSGLSSDVKRFVNLYVEADHDS